MRLGFMTFGDLDADPHTGVRPSIQERLDNIVNAAVMTEEMGLDAFGVGEHHAAKWVLTAPPVVMAAIAARTKRIRLMTGVTLLSNLDPVRVAEDYGTVDVLSDGRVDLVAAKGFFPHPWKLFGQDPEENRDRLAENIDLLSKIWAEEPVTWKGRYRPPLEAMSIGPRPIQDPPPIWCGISSAPSSADFAADRGLGIIIGASVHSTEHYGQIVDHYRERAAEAGFTPESLRVGCSNVAFVGKDGDKARRHFEPYLRQGVAFSLRERGLDPATTPLNYDERLAGPVLCGSPTEVVERVLELHERLGHSVQTFQTDLGGMPWRDVVESMELIATEVAPALRRALGDSDGASPAEVIDQETMIA